jgi:hypothetical protein
MAFTTADILSIIAIAISLVAIYQVTSVRTRDMAIKARTDLNLIQAGLETAEERISRASLQWQAVFLASGMSHSGARKQKLQEIEELRSKVGQLSKELADMKVLVLPVISNFSIDRCATRVKTILLRWELLSSDIDALVTEAKENRALLNRN